MHDLQYIIPTIELIGANVAVIQARDESVECQVFQIRVLWSLFEYIVQLRRGYAAFVAGRAEVCGGNVRRRKARGH